MTNNVPDLSEGLPQTAMSLGPGYSLRKYTPGSGSLLNGLSQAPPATPSELSWEGAQWFWAFELQKLLASDSTACLYPQETIVTSVELGEDWERTEALHKKFEEFQADLEARREKVEEINKYARESAEVRWGAKGQCGGKVPVSKTFQPSVDGLRRTWDIVRKQGCMTLWQHARGNFLSCLGPSLARPRK